MTRGVRNNNPANIILGDGWLGLKAAQTDPKFCQFVSVEYGVRAMIVLLKTYVTVHQADTIEKIIHRWAPISDGNDEMSYVSTIKTTLKSNDFLVNWKLDSSFFHGIEPWKVSWLFYLCQAMCRVESEYNLEYKTFLKAYVMQM